jgi:hypothetical protein
MVPKVPVMPNLLLSLMISPFRLHYNAVLLHVGHGLQNLRLLDIIHGSQREVTALILDSIRLAPVQ